MLTIQYSCRGVHGVHFDQQRDIRMEGRKEGRKEGKVFILASIHIQDEIQYNAFSLGDHHLTISSTISLTIARWTLSLKR